MTFLTCSKTEKKVEFIAELLYWIELYWLDFVFYVSIFNVDNLISFFFHFLFGEFIIHFPIFYSNFPIFYFKWLYIQIFGIFFQELYDFPL